MKRTANNDLVLNQKGLSLQNLIVIISVLSAVVFFFGLFGITIESYGEEESMRLNGFMLMTFRGQMEKAGLDEYGLSEMFGFMGIFSLLLIVPAVSAAIGILNKRGFKTEKSFSLVMGQYLFLLIGNLISVGLLWLLSVLMKVMTELAGSLMSYLSGAFEAGITFFGGLYILLSLLNIVLAFIGIVKTGALPVDETAVAAELLTKEQMQAAKNLAGAAAGKVAATASSAASAAQAAASRMQDAGQEPQQEAHGESQEEGNPETAGQQSRTAKAGSGSYCIHCGKFNPAGSKFCMGCGMPLKTPEPAEGEAVSWDKVFDQVMQETKNGGESETN